VLTLGGEAFASLQQALPQRIHAPERLVIAVLAQRELQQRHLERVQRDHLREALQPLAQRHRQLLGQRVQLLGRHVARLGCLVLDALGMEGWLVGG